jgi:peroxiredoxin
MKKIALLFSTLVMLFMNSNAQKNHFTIIGETEGFKDSTMLFLHDVDNSQIVDSALILNNKFKFAGIVNEPKQYMIATSFNKKEMPEYVFVWLEPAEIRIHAIKGQLKFAVISGSKVQDQATILDKMMRPVNKEMDSIQNLFRSATRNDTMLYRSLVNKQNELIAQRTKIEKRYIAEHPDFLNSAFTLTYTMRKLPKEEAKELFAGFTERNKTSRFGIVIKNYIEKSKKFEIGDKAEDFRLENLKGEKVSLGNFKGKYVLIEFWGSGCGPCRTENPNLLRNYKTYKDKGFEIVSISLDKNRKEMERAILKDSMIWTTVSDLQGIEGLVPTIYNVTYIPKNYLINPEGVIVAMDLRGRKLEDKLKELFVKE